MKPNSSVLPIEMIVLLIVMLVALLATPAHAGAGWGPSINITGAPIQVQTYYANSPSGMRPDPLIAGATINTGVPLRKFVDTLPGLGAAGANNLGQYIPVAAPEKWVDGNGNVTNDDYYEIAVVEYTEKMHSDLIKPTRLRGYVQLETPGNAATSKHVPLKYPDGTPIVDAKGVQVYAYDNPHYLGPLIQATKGVAVRIKYTNYLPVGAAGSLFLPVDKTLAGAGKGPDGVTLFTENRADIHLHGGDSPWISDGTPHQWIAPTGEKAAYAAIDPGTGLSMGKGASSQNVPDMPNPGPGSMTLYFPNNLSARMMFYHDHTSGITRLNVYAGMAAGYLVSDPVEQGLITSGVIPATQIPLVIQDKTFVPKDIAQQDAKWDILHWGQEGDLWFPHVYETNQDPNALNGTNPVGRWDWGPWFWPVFPSQYSLPTGVYGDVTTTPEAFMDTPVINGTAYPTLTVDPKAYRFRILNASNDRYLNLSLFVADPTIPAVDPVTGLANPGFGKEVKMVPAAPNPAFPPTWPTDARAGGTPDPTLAGPDIIQIGNEGGLLPHPAILKAQPVTYEQNRKVVTVLNVLDHSLYLGGAERADVIVDFSQFAGKTLILYNDAPAPNPAFDPRNDYYTGDVDQSASGGAYPTTAGYGPNTRTIMQIKVNAVAAAAPYNVAALQAALPVAYGQSQPKPVIPESAYNAAFGTSDTDNYANIFVGSTSSPTFNWTPTAAGQVVTGVILTGGGTGYTSAPTVVFTGGVDLSPAGIAAGNAAATATATVDPVTRKVTGITLVSGGSGYTSAPLITFTGGGGMGATASVRTSLTQSLPVYNKAIQELFEPLYGRMNATLGVEMPFTSAVVQTTIPLGYIDPATETIAAGETQIWKITHNGVDAHPVHFHKLNVQLINRVGWDGQIKPPSASEVGWKETVVMNPLEDVIVAVRATRESIPFGVPQSVRPMDPSQPLGSTLGFTQVDLTGNPTAQPNTPGYNANWGMAVPPKTIKNAIVNFDNEYVWHCHILGHEENDFMRPFVFNPLDVVPDAPTNLSAVGAGVLTWNDPTPTTPPAVNALGIPTLGNPKNEIGFKILRSSNNGPFTQVGTALANAASWADPTWAATTIYSYQVVAYNAVGSSLPSNTVAMTAGLSPAALTFAPQLLGVASTAPVTLSNYGATPLAVTSITIGGANAADFTQTNNCGVSLGTGATGSCTINVTFRPSLAGTKTATLTVVDAAGTQSITLSGAGGVPSATLTPALPLTFAAQAAGTPSAAQTMTLTNTGIVPLAINSISIAGANPLSFSQTNTCGTGVPARGSCTISVVFKPDAIGTRAATLSVVDAAAARTVTLNGTGTIPPVTAVSVTPDKISPQVPGSVVTFTASATGWTGTYEYYFTLFNPNTKQWSIGQAYSANAVWAWNTAGLAPGTYTLQVWARNVGSTAPYEAWTGISYTIVPAPVTSVSVASDKIAPQAPGSLITFTATATGGTGPYEYYFTFRNPNTGQWSVGQAYSTNAVWAWNTTGLAAGTYTLQVWARNVGSTAPYEAWTSASYTIAPTTLVPVTSVSVAPDKTGPQAAGSVITFTASALGGTGPYEYYFTLLNPNTGQWSVGQAYSPNAVWAWNTAGLAAGTYTLQVWARNVGSTAPYEAWTGTGYTITTAPTATLTPASSLTFAAQTVGTSSIAQVMTLTNTGTVPLPITSISIGGTNPLSFSQTNTCGTSVPVAGNCTVSVVFKPDAIGVRTATLTIVDGAATRNVTLNGTGQ